MEPPPPPASPPARPRPVHRLAPVLWALLFGSLVCFAMLATRRLLSHHTRFSFLFWNLFLAWIPLGLSLLLRSASPERGWKPHLFWLAGFLWVCFYPNSFYIVTDLVHMPKFGQDGVPFWYDMMVTVGFAFAGVFLGSLALYLLHLIVRERFGYRIGWAFAILMLALASLGIYLGRFQRSNSWDVFTRPWRLWGHMTKLVDQPERLAAFSVTFFFFSLMAYLFVVGMARLHEGDV
jgi:uncharacterized membrane protein